MTPRRWVLNTASVPFDISKAGPPTEPTEVMPVADVLSPVAVEAAARVDYAEVARITAARSWDQLSADERKAYLDHARAMLEAALDERRET